jgi:hypothetical protein
MRVFKMEVMVLDFDETLDKDSVIYLTQNNRYICPHVLAIDSRDIGEWSDDNPLNRADTQKAELDRLFNKPERGCSL